MLDSAVGDEVLPRDEPACLEPIDDARHVGGIAVELARGFVHRQRVAELPEEHRLRKGEVELGELGVVVARQGPAHVHQEPDDLLRVGRLRHLVLSIS